MLPFRIAIAVLSLFVIFLACDKPVIIQIEDVNGEATCVVSPLLADFGAIPIGNETEELFTVRNTGSGLLTGFLSLLDSSGSFEIVTGGGAFQLGGGERRVVLVRFAPVEAGEVTCQLRTNTGCRPVVCTGIGRVGATCELSPASITFPSISVGLDTVESFTVTNNGDEALFGNLFASCDRFQITSGNGPFILGPDSSFQITVRFAPGDTLFEECAIFLSGDACDSVSVSGQGTRARFPACAVSATALDFGSIETAASAEKTLRLYNVGEASLAGSVAIGPPCTAFAIVSGDGAYTIPPNDSLLVVVAFTPGSDPGAFACSLSLGTPFCPDPITLAGTAEAPAECAIEPGTIDFGTVFTGSEATQTLVIRNAGGSTLAGTVGEACDDVLITAGSGAYALAAGESLVVAVRYEPDAPGALACTLDFGNALCPEPVALTGSAIAPGNCAVSETTVDFDTVTVGESASLSFTLTNNGGASYDGTIGNACAPFTIDAGGGAYTLAPQEVRTVDISFAPAGGGAFVCTLETGCDSRVVLRGAGDPPPLCRLEPDSLDFGSINPGQAVTRSFTIANDGGQNLAGRISIPCQANFRLVEGEDPEYSLGGGESRVVTVRFSPQLEGEKKCTFTFGNALCSNIEAVGFGDALAECLISPTNLSFPNRTIGEDTTLAFVVKNTGGSTLSGTVTAPCEHFSVVTGTEDYALAADESDTIQVRFAPTAAGPLNCTLVTGCAQNVDVSGTGKLPPICSLFVAGTQFDTVTIGSSRDLTLSVSNVGAGTLAGSLSLVCDDYAIVGTPSYSLGAGASAAFTVRYTPSDTLLTTCDVTTGCDSAIVFSGRGVRAPVCALSTTAIDFDSVLVGESASDSFTISNTGGGVLSGAIAASCGDLSVTAGAGSYALGEGESRLVVLSFAPTSQGPFSCDVTTGCEDDVQAIGTGYSLVSCSLSTTSLGYGTISTGSTKDLSFTIKNTGAQTISGSALEFCNEYSITSGSGAFSLTTGQSRTVTVRFSPTNAGTFNCSINLGTDCGAVSMTGVAELGPVCDLSATSRNFGNVAPTKTADQSFSITNTGGGTLTGSVSISGSFFSIVSGGGSYSLGANQSRTVTVRFSPSATTCGVRTGTVTTGGSCQSVSLSGNARETWNNYVKATLGPTPGGLGCTDCHSSGSGIGDFTNINDVKANVNLGTPTASKLLRFPAPNGDAHSGGDFACFTISSGECYQRVLCWIQAGAPQ